MIDVSFHPAFNNKALQNIYHNELGVYFPILVYELNEQNFNFGHFILFKNILMLADDLYSLERLKNEI